MIELVILLSFFLAIFLGRLIIPGIILVSFRKRLFDIPDSRKKHIGIIPRLGGFAFLPVQLCLFTFFIVLLEYFVPDKIHPLLGVHHRSFLLLFCALVILFMVGVVDDLIGMSYKRKFLAQLIAACLMPLGGIWINNLYGIAKIVEVSPLVGIPLTIFGILLIVNAVNLIDGLDGLCSGLVATGCITMGLLFLYHGAYLFALFALITAGVLFPFFYYNVFGTNRRRHRIFMGDTGSLTLGYSLAFLSISYTMLNPTIKPFSEGAVVVAYSTIFIPVMDVATVMWWRLRNRRPLFHPDRNHIHHKMLRLGMNNHQAMISILLIAFFFGGMNVILVNYISNNLVLAIDILLWVWMNVVIGYLNQKRSVEKKTQAKEKQLLKEAKGKFSGSNATSSILVE